MKNRLQKGDALLIVDAQNDFFPGGALGVPEGDATIPIINFWLDKANKNDIPIFASRDWHPKNHCSFKPQGGPWPIHCVQHTPGSMIHPKIHLPEDINFINKAFEVDKEVYSAFEGKTAEGIGLASLMKKNQIQRIWILGLALDYCVIASALDALKEGFEVHVILEGTRAITKETGDAALKKMAEAGVMFE